MELELFKMDTCPFCRKVFRGIEEMGRTDIEMHDINSSAEERERLIREGGPANKAALDSGFGDYSAFHRAFKASFGISPGKLKQ